MKQNFKEITLHFRLRNSKDRKTLIVGVIYYSGVMYRFSSGVSVVPDHWNKKKECAVISPLLNDTQNNNNRIVNDRLSEIRTTAQNLFAHGIISVEQIKTCMKKKQNKATTMLNEAFKRTVTGNSGSTYKNKESMLKTIFTCIKNDDISFFTQNVLFDVRKELENDRSADRTNLIISFLCGLINDIRGNGVNIPEPIMPTKIKTAKTHKEESKHFEILQSEIDAINALTLSGRKDKARSMFNIQLLCGQRHSDLSKVIEGINNKDDVNGILQIKTQKCNTTAHIQVTDELCKWVERYNNNTCIHIKQTQLFNKILKELFNESGCKRTHRYNGKECNVCDIVSSHCARHTFITKMLRDGYTPEQVSYFSGNSANEIRKTYEHLTMEDKRNEVLKIIGSNRGNDVFNEYFAEDILRQLADDVKEDIDIIHVDREEINRFVRAVNKPLPENVTATDKKRFINIRDNCFYVCKVLHNLGNISASGYYYKFIRKARKLNLTTENVSIEQIEYIFED